MMKEIKKIRYNRNIMPKCPACGKELGKDIDGMVMPFCFMSVCSCGQKLEWKEKKLKDNSHFILIPSMISGNQTMLFLPGMQR